MTVLTGRMSAEVKPFEVAPELGPTGKQMISIRGLLEWAFATECAQLDYDELEAASS